MKEKAKRQSREQGTGHKRKQVKEQGEGPARYSIRNEGDGQDTKEATR